MDYKLFFIIFLLMLISFGAGATYGASKIAYKLMSIGEQVLDIQLSPQARDILINKPELMSYAIQNYQNVTNPFIQEQARLHFDECMLKTGNETTCYAGIVAKYGTGTLQ